MPCPVTTSSNTSPTSVLDEVLFSFRAPRWLYAASVLRNSIWIPGLFASSLTGYICSLRMSGRILIVDDESSARFALELLLRREGFDVHEVHDGASALVECSTFRP